MRKKSAQKRNANGLAKPQASASRDFPGFREVLNATRRMRGGEVSDEEMDDPTNDELKKDPNWCPAAAGRSL